MEQVSLPRITGGLQTLLQPETILNEQEAKALNVLSVYFSDSEEASLRKLFNAPLGFLPLAGIVAFKAVRDARVEISHLLAAAAALGDAFEVSFDSLNQPLLRRRVSFVQRSIEDSLRETVAFATSCCLFRQISADAINLDFVAFIQSKFGLVSRFLFSLDSFDPESKSCYIQFTDPQAMIKLLASPNLSLSYEDAPISVDAAQFPENSTISNSNSSSRSFTYTASSIQQQQQPLVASTQQSTTLPRRAIFQMGHGRNVKASAVLGYPLNRVIKFGPVLYADSASVQAAARNAFERLAPLTECVFRQNEIYGYVRFKKSVAKEIAETLTRQGGGIDFGITPTAAVGTTTVPVFALSGESERLFYDVLKERAAGMNPIGSFGESVIALSESVKASKARKSARRIMVIAAAMKRKRVQGKSKMVPKRRNGGGVAVPISGDASGTVKKAGNKREFAASVGDEIDTVSNDKKTLANEQQQALTRGRRKKPKTLSSKIDDLEDLVKGLSTFG
ncbi:hypothetical protein HK100_004879 [Physocladia obscura]|uniref:Uncharacterized protein n=1 Tax=Physocladia obscura TaxID=109957 RepID=A0AAD5X9P0_9FUNG|nr:hypothetical protein HK100_004879 [Physocladia obscura]